MGLQEEQLSFLSIEMCWHFAVISEMVRTSQGTPYSLSGLGMAILRGRIYTTAWLLLLCSLPLVGCGPSAPSPGKLKKDISFCKSVIDVVPANDKRCGPYLAAIRAELAREKEVAGNSSPSSQETGVLASPAAVSPKWINGKMTLQCSWSQTKKLAIPGSNVDESKTTTGSDEVVLDQNASTVNNEKASFSSEEISWTKDSIDNNVAKRETVTTSMRRSINRTSLKYSGFDSYKAEGGIGGLFLSYGPLDGQCTPKIQLSSDPAKKI